MLVCMTDDCHCRISMLYELAKDLETTNQCEVDLVVQIGDPGMWSNNENIDRATRVHNQFGEFYVMQESIEKVPGPTVFFSR